MENRIPVWLIILYVVSVLIAFIASSVQIGGALTFGGASFSLAPSQWAWLLPAAVLFPLVIRIFLSRGGTFKWLGIEAQINIAREAKEAAQHADAKAKNVSNDVDRAFSEVNARIQNLENAAGLTAEEPSDIIGGSASQEVKEHLHIFARAYASASGSEAATNRREINKNIRDMPAVAIDTVYALTDLSWEYQSVAAILLERFAQDKKQAGEAFDALLNLLIQGPNSLVRFRAANAMKRASWDLLDRSMVKDRLDVLRQRSYTEPNEATAVEIKAVIQRLLQL